GVGKILGRLLRDVVPDTVQDLMGVLSGEHLSIGCAVFGLPVEIAADGYRWHRDHRSGSKFRVEVVVARLALSKPEPPAVVVYDDVDVVGVVECRGGAVVGGIIELPSGRGAMPNELIEVVGVLPVATRSAIGR